MKKFRPKKRTTTGRDYLDAIGSKNPRARKIIQLSLEGTLIKIHNTVKEAAESIEIKPHCIYSNLSAKRGQSAGYKWMYLEEYEKLKSAN